MAGSDQIFQYGPERESSYPEVEERRFPGWRLRCTVHNEEGPVRTYSNTSADFIESSDAYHAAERDFRQLPCVQENGYVAHPTIVEHVDAETAYLSD